MKYLINIPESCVIRSPLKGEVLGIPLLVSATQKTYTLPTEIQLEPHTEPDRKTIDLRHARDIEKVAKMNYNEGVKDAWEFAKTVSIMKPEDKRECWGTDKYNTINLGCSYQEAKDRYEAWRKQKDEIRVGDEVKHRGLNYVVGYVGADKVYHLIDKNWLRTVVQGGYQLIKTGRHFPEVAELLKKMGDTE